MSEIDDRVRFAMAVHESGHAVAYALLGDTVDAVSIEVPAGADGRRGVCLTTRRHDLPLPSPVEVAFLMPMGARLQLERELAAVLAGPIAQAVYAPLPSQEYELPSRDEEHVAGVIERRHALLERRATELLDVEDQFTRVHVTDQERAFELSRWTGTGGAAHHLQWLAHEVELWVRHELFRQPLAAVARALFHCGELDGRTVHRLIASATKQTIEREEVGNA